MKKISQYCKDISQFSVNVLLILLMAVLIVTISRGSLLYGKFGGNEITINAIDDRLNELWIAFDDMKQYLAFHAIWDINKILADSAFHQEQLEALKERLGGDDRGVIVTAYLLDPMTGTGLRYWLGSTAKGEQSIILGSKVSTGWNESLWRAESINSPRPLYIGVVNGISDYDYKSMLGLNSQTLYKMYDATAVLSTEQGRYEMNWALGLGSMCLFATGKIGHQSIFLLSIDFDPATNEEVQQNMRLALTHVPRTIKIMEDRMKLFNPSIADVKYLYD